MSASARDDWQVAGGTRRSQQAPGPSYAAVLSPDAPSPAVEDLVSSVASLGTLVQQGQRDTARQLEGLAATLTSAFSRVIADLSPRPLETPAPPPSARFAPFGAPPLSASPLGGPPSPPQPFAPPPTPRSLPLTPLLGLAAAQHAYGRNDGLGLADNRAPSGGRARSSLPDPPSVLFRVGEQDFQVRQLRDIVRNMVADEVAGLTPRHAASFVVRNADGSVEALGEPGCFQLSLLYGYVFRLIDPADSDTRAALALHQTTYPPDCPIDVAFISGIHENLSHLMHSAPDLMLEGVVRRVFALVHPCLESFFAALAATEQTLLAARRSGSLPKLRFLSAALVDLRTGLTAWANEVLLMLQSGYCSPTTLTLLHGRVHAALQRLPAADGTRFCSAVDIGIPLLLLARSASSLDEAFRRPGSQVPPFDLPAYRDALLHILTIQHRSDLGRSTQDRGGSRPLPLLAAAAAASAACAPPVAAAARPSARDAATLLQPDRAAPGLQQCSLCLIPVQPGGHYLYKCPHLPAMVSLLRSSVVDFPAPTPGPGKGGACRICQQGHFSQACPWLQQGVALWRARLPTASAAVVDAWEEGEERAAAASYVAEVAEVAGAFSESSCSSDDDAPTLRVAALEICPADVAAEVAAVLSSATRSAPVPSDSCCEVAPYSLRPRPAAPTNPAAALPQPRAAALPAATAAPSLLPEAVPVSATSPAVATPAPAQVQRAAPGRRATVDMPAPFTTTPYASRAPLGLDPTATLDYAALGPGLHRHLLATHAAQAQFLASQRALQTAHAATAAFLVTLDTPSPASAPSAAHEPLRPGLPAADMAAIEVDVSAVQALSVAPSPQWHFNVGAFDDGFLQFTCTDASTLRPVRALMDTCAMCTMFPESDLSSSQLALLRPLDPAIFIKGFDKSGSRLQCTLGLSVHCVCGVREGWLTFVPAPIARPLLGADFMDLLGIRSLCQVVDDRLYPLPLVGSPFPYAPFALCQGEPPQRPRDAVAAEPS